MHRLGVAHAPHPTCRLQTQNMGIRMGASRNPAMYRGTLDALVRIAREEGLAGLYRWGGERVGGELVRAEGCVLGGGLCGPEQWAKRG